MTSEVKVIRSCRPSDARLPITRQRKLSEAPKLAGRVFRAADDIASCSFKVKRLKVKVTRPLWVAVQVMERRHIVAAVQLVPTNATSMRRFSAVCRRRTWRLHRCTRRLNAQNSSTLPRHSWTSTPRYCCVAPPRTLQSTLSRSTSLASLCTVHSSD